MIYLSSRLSSGPPGGRPRARLKAGTPVLTAMNRRSTKAEATWRAPTFKTMVKRAVCAALGDPHQHQEATSHPSRRRPPKQPSWSRNIPLVRINAVTLGRTVGLQDCSGETCSLSEETQAPQRQQLLPPARRHEHGWESLLHFRPPCKQWGRLLSSD